MKEFWTTIQLVFSAVGGWLGYFLGGCDGLIYTLLAFVVLDYVTGIMCAIVDKRLSSQMSTCWSGRRPTCWTCRSLALSVCFALLSFSFTCPMRACP